MLTTNSGRDFTRETPGRIYHPPDSIVNQTGLIFAVIDLPVLPSRPARIVDADKPLFGKFSLCQNREQGLDHT